MFAFPAGQAAPRGQLGRRGEQRGAEKDQKRRATIKKRKGVLFQSFELQAPEGGEGAFTDF